MSDDENLDENIIPIDTITIGPSTDGCLESSAIASRYESSCNRTNKEAFNGIRCLQNSLDSYRSAILSEPSGQICANELNEALLENVIKIHTLLSLPSGSVETEIPGKPIQYLNKLALS